MAVMVVLAGCGNMGYAMLSGWLKSAKLAPAEVFVVEPNAELRERAAKLGALTAADAADLPADIAPALVIFAVKPQVMRDVVPAYRRFAGGGTTFLSIAAGIGIAVFEDLLGGSAAIVRCMPNTPAAIGKGMMVVVSNANVTDEAKAFVADLLSASGEVATIDDEGLMDAVTAVSGSGPAYVFHFIEALTAAARNRPACRRHGEAARHADGLWRRLARRRKPRGPGHAAPAGDQPERHHGRRARRADGRATG